MKFLKKLGQFVIHSMFMSAVFSLSLTVLAEELSNVDAEALDKTVDLLNDPSQRQALIDENEGAKKADAMAKSLMGEGEDLQAIYKAAGEIFRKVAGQNGGNAEDMMETLSKAQRNPEGFYKSLSPEHQKMIQELGKKANDRNKVNRP